MNRNDQLEKLEQHVARLRHGAAVVPDASVIMPVNAQGDLGNVMNILNDLTNYQGNNTFEIILVINNFPPDNLPEEIEKLRDLGITVVDIPSVRRPGEAVGFSARIPGVRASKVEPCILFDADCRVPNPTAVLDWYVKQFQNGAKAAYSHVDFYDLRKGWSIKTRIFIHHAARWYKRNILKIPTTRGSNYGVQRTMMLDLYERKMLADEMNVGPTFKAQGAKIAYSGSRKLRVLTSGRMFTPGGGPMKLFRYFRYRLRYNKRTLPVRENVASFTKRENDPVRRFVDNKQVH
ncbi:MAG: hypothetical protein AAF614_32185 [Chloroflexota bacterium]